MAIQQSRQVVPPVPTDHSLQNFTSVVQKNLLDLHQVAHTHQVITEAPSANSGNVGDIYIVQTPTQTYLTVKTSAGWMRQETNFVDVRNFGAVGDGNTDDTAAIQAAINTGVSVYIPSTTKFYNISTILFVRTSGQRIFGDGSKSLIKQSGTGTNATIFQTNDSLSGIVFENLCVVPGTSVTGITSGVGFLINGCTGSQVRGCEVYGHKHAGIMVYRSSNCIVTNNYVHDSAVTTSDLVTGADIFIYYGGSNNVISNNTILNGSGDGIALQEEASDTVQNNTVVGNTVDGEGAYGIVIYVGGSGAVTDNAVIGNVVRNVTGSNPEAASGHHVYGTGIYIQGAERTTIVGNIIENTNLYTDLNQLAPGCIGVTNCTTITISGNHCKNSNGWNGITVRNPNDEGDSTGFAVVSGNNLVNHAVGIELNQRSRVNIIGNGIDTIAGHGIFVKNTTQHSFVNIADNTIINCGANGIAVAYTDQVSITGNICKAFVLQGINVGQGTDVLVANNILENGSSAGGSVGLEIDPVVVGCLCVGNYITTNSIGVLLSSVCTLNGNKVSGNTSNFSTSQFSGMYAGAAPTTGTWLLADVVYNASPTSGGFIGWVCTVAGTPGTWKTFGLIS